MRKAIITEKGITYIDLTEEEIENIGGGKNVDIPVFYSLEEKVAHNNDYLLNIDFRVLMLEFGIF